MIGVGGTPAVRTDVQLVKGMLHVPSNSADPIWLPALVTAVDLAKKEASLRSLDSSRVDLHDVPLASLVPALYDPVPGSEPGRLLRHVIARDPNAFDQLLTQLLETRVVKGKNARGEQIPPALKVTAS